MLKLQAEFTDMLVFGQKLLNLRQDGMEHILKYFTQYCRNETLTKIYYFFRDKSEWKGYRKWISFCML